MGYPRGLPRSRIWRKGIGEGIGGSSSSSSSSSSGDGSNSHGGVGGVGVGVGDDSTGDAKDDGQGDRKDGVTNNENAAALVGDEGPFRESPRTARRRRPWLRVVFGLFLVLELVILILVNRFSPVFDFEITSVADGETVLADNPDLVYPIKLGGGTHCRPADLTACVAEDVSTTTLATLCCVELLDPDSDGPEELISTVMLIGYVFVIPALILLMRGFLLGRVWALTPSTVCRDSGESAWGKKRWHLRVGFYSVDTCLGLATSVLTSILFVTITKATVGRPRPNYFALRIFSDNAANGDDFYDESVLSWPSGHAASAMAGLLFLAFVLWGDLMGLVRWRRRVHPRITLVLAVLGGFVIVALPLAAILIGVTRIRDYWHNPDDVLAGLVLGAAAAHWSFRFVVMMPFNHEIGTPEWTPHPKWVEEEERQWEKEEEAMMGCPWRGRRRTKRARIRAMDDLVKAAAQQPPQVLPPTRAPEADEVTGTENVEFVPV